MEAQDQTTPDTSLGASLRPVSLSPYSVRAPFSAGVLRSSSVSGTSTPPPLASRPTSAHAQDRRAMHEGAVLAALRRQMEAFEEKVGAQMIRMERQTDFARDAAFSRLEDKLIYSERLQPKLERQLAELSGNVKGLSDELQAQIRRMETMEDKFWEWRHQLEEEFRRKYTVQEQEATNMASRIHILSASHEEVQKRNHQRLQRLEDQPHVLQEDVRESFQAVWSRLETMDVTLSELSARQAERAPQPSPSCFDESANAAHISLLDKRLGDIVGRVDTEAENVREMRTRVATMEEQFKTLRERSENRDQSFRAFVDRVDHSDWDTKIERVRQDMQEQKKVSSGHGEHIELLGRRLEEQEQASEELRGAHKQVPSLWANDPVLMERLAESEERLSECEARIRALIIEVQTTHADSDLKPHVQQLSEGLRMMKADVQDAVARVLQLDEQTQKGTERVGILTEEIDVLRSNSQVHEHISSLVDQLKEVAPKLIQHESDIRAIRDGYLSKLSAELQELQTDTSPKLVVLEQSIASLQFKQNEAREQNSISQELKMELQQIKATLKEQDNGTQEVRQELKLLETRLTESLALHAARQMEAGQPREDGVEDVKAQLQQLKVMFEDIKLKPDGVQEVRAELQDFKGAFEDALATLREKEIEVKHVHAEGVQEVPAKLQAHEDGIHELRSQVQNLVGILDQQGKSINNVKERFGDGDMSALASKIGFLESAIKKNADAAAERDVAGMIEKITGIWPKVEEHSLAIQELRRASEEAPQQYSIATPLGVTPTPAQDRELNDVQARVFALEEAAASRGGQMDAEQKAQLALLVTAVQQDEEAELVAHRRLVKTIDEVCKSLPAMERALASGGGSIPSDGMLGPGIPADFPDRAQGLAKRVQELSGDKAKFDDEMGTKFREFGVTAS